jgi:catechol 2,3-dioxygenase
VGLNTWAAGSPIATDEDARLLEWQLALPGRSEVDKAVESLRDSGHDVRSSDGTFTATDPWGIVVRWVAA